MGIALPPFAIAAAASVVIVINTFDTEADELAGSAATANKADDPKPRRINRFFSSALPSSKRTRSVLFAIFIWAAASACVAPSKKQSTNGIR
jgi:hypothetical protein